MRRGQRARDEVAGDRGEHERERAGDEDAAADQLDVGLHVVERVDEHRDAAHAGALALAARSAGPPPPPGGRPTVCSVEVTVRCRVDRLDGRRLDVGLRRSRPGLESAIG